MNSAGVDLQIILSSEFQWQNLKNYNLIYVGSFKSLGMLDQLTNNSNFRFNLYHNDLQFKVLETDSIYNYLPSGSSMDNAYETDYCIVTKLPGPNQKEVIMFISVRDIGLIATMDYFSNTETLSLFEEIIQDQNTKYFEACFKIQGLDRNSMSIDLLHLNKLSPTSLFELDP